MKVALLINDKESRETLARGIQAKGATTDEFATAAKALGMLVASRYDLIVIHWQVHPGIKASDPKLQELASMIPVISMNRNVLYWETALRVLDIVRAEDSMNKATPVIVLFPGLDEPGFKAEDRLARESVDSDLAKRQPATVISAMLSDEIIGMLGRHLSNALSRH
jgi:hypothetical protein